MAPRVSDKPTTPVPRRENELKAFGHGEVVTYQLSDEELAKYRALPVPDKKEKMPVGVRIVHTETQLQRRRDQMKEENGMPLPKEGPTCGLTKEILIEQVAKGETFSSIEKAWGMKYNAIHYWIKKWGLKGITPEIAQDLLSESTQPGNSKTEQPLLRESDVPSGIELQAEVDKLRLANKTIQSECDRPAPRRDEYRWQLMNYPNRWLS
ncbi:hypothetical protein [Paenibacillus azoreducens]|uniref:hypothetical protein n=1 Tax=Paenibacillus azoreducens TaxID=116718 RepID=UPI001F2ECB78|nr:hypothetical protein [Paenibacillus azoreducens]